MEAVASIHRRNPWLDFLRATAIIAVLTYHIGQYWTIDYPGLRTYTSFGAKGVDLFFVLSGWLIGGLFWRERQKNGKVDLLRFWMRRWWRTIPPYLGGLLLAWLAVRLYRNESFNIGYLVFIQNYYNAIPFFLVSWSLCIEEHFYFFIPLFFSIIRLQPKVYLPLFAILPLISRCFEYFPNIMLSQFGYSLTASHLYADGIVLGFWAAYVGTYHESLLAKYSPVIVILAILAGGLFLLDLGEKFQYIFHPFLIAIACLGALVSMLHHPKNKLFAHKTVVWIAKISYSVYLIHALVIHVFIKVIHPMFDLHNGIALIIQIALILFAGWVFHLIFERSAFAMRERWVPVRAG